MSISIAQSRQQLSSLIAAAQQEPQVITNRNTPVAVLVSADYFARSQAAVHALEQVKAESLYDQVMQLRGRWLPQDDAGLPVVGMFSRETAWQRENAFSKAPENRLS
jgi:prevent-host-death family protein